MKVGIFSCKEIAKCRADCLLLIFTIGTKHIKKCFVLVFVPTFSIYGIADIQDQVVIVELAYVCVCRTWHDYFLYAERFLEIFPLKGLFCLFSTMTLDSLPYMSRNTNIALFVSFPAGITTDQ